MLVLKRNLVVGFVLCIAIFSFVVPLLLGMRGIPDSIVGEEGMVVISQREQEQSLNSSLVLSLRSSDSVAFLSSEILVPTLVHGHPILCRGVDSEDILELDHLTLEGEWLDTNTGVMGVDAAKRMGVKVGDRLLVTSPSRESFVYITVVGIYSSERPADSLFISIEYARFLMGMGKDTYTLIRLDTEDPGEVLEIVDRTGTAVTNIERPPEPVDPENRTEEDYTDDAMRLGRRLDFFSMEGLGGGNTSIAIQYGRQTVDMVVVGMLIMAGTLVVVGTTVMILRGIAEGRKDLGVLVAIGTPRKTIRRFFFQDVFTIMAVATPLGVAIGLSMAHVLTTVKPIVAFGNTIHPASLGLTVLVAVSGSITIPVFAWLLGGEGAIGEHPHTLFAPIDVDVPQTTLCDILKGGDVK